jgi:hypothetical protein
MMADMANKEQLNTESDVEQKFFWQLLTNPYPVGLGYSSAEVYTKLNIRRLEIGKGITKHLYYPDYMIILEGLPILICEAKSPDITDLSKALEEARMYSWVLNSFFPSGVNPCSWILVGNGIQLILCRSDTIQISKAIFTKQINAGDADYAELNKEINRMSLSAYAHDLNRSLYRNRFYQPVAALGGKTIRDEEMYPNTFGSTLALDFRHIFSPATLTDRAYLVKNAYVKSRRRERYIEPIDKFIRRIVTPSVKKLPPIEDTSAPIEISKILRRGRSLEHQILLLIGSVGSGKSTFVDYLVNVGLPTDILQNTLWLRIDMNNAPAEVKKAYEWLPNKIVEDLKASDEKIDFDDIKTIMHIYSAEIRSLKKGPLSMLGEDSSSYKEKFADALLAMQQNVLLTARALSRYLCAERSRLLVIALDNCDKRDRDGQLLMFQLANWVQAELNCLVILPLRDVTYEAHKTQPPLDTAQKDLVFRIEPPALTEVLKQRFYLVLKEMEGRGERSTLEYTLRNGVRITYPASDQGLYLACILRSLFEYDRFLRRLLTSLAGRDVRLALEMFMEFCRSGHITESEIFRIRQSKGDYVIPLEIINRVLLRKNRRFYNGDVSYLKNLFQCDISETKPDYFVRLAILRYLDSRNRESGPSGIMGLHRIADLIKSLVIWGHTAERIRKELLYLARAKCVNAEHLRTDFFSDDELVAITSSGSIHLDMLENVDYLASCAEETWFDSDKIAGRIAEKIGKNAYIQYSLSTAFQNAKELITYLSCKLPALQVKPNRYLEDSSVENFYDISRAEKSILGIARSYEESRISGRIYLGNLPYDLMKESLGDLIEKLGFTVSDIYMPDSTSVKRGCAFVTLKDIKKTDEAIDKIGKIKINGRQVIANYAIKARR